LSSDGIEDEFRGEPFSGGFGSIGADRKREENDTFAVVLLVALRDYCALITAGVS